MCRIAGIYLNNHSTNKKLHQVITSMTNKMKHGGPDDCGIYLDEANSVALGNRRLSIIDLSNNGHQPMSNSNKDIFITYNGEVYNFPELRRELINEGVIFISNSDTEVVLKAYEKWGEKAFNRFNGMFAFCIYDKRTDQIFLVRDHAGIKPLYYFVSKERLIFASEIKTFRVYDKSWDSSRLL